MKPSRLAFLVTAAAAAAAGVQHASADTPKFKIFGAASYVSPLSEDDVTIGTVRDSVQASDELGWNVGFEARFSKVVGLEVDYVNVTNDVEFGDDVIGEVDMQPLSATLNFHVIPTGIVDLYVGPTASYFIFGDVELDDLGDVETDNELAYGASVGLEIGLGDTLAIMGGLRWLKVDLDFEDTVETGVDPLFSRLGLALRF
ncbi:MAG TPA: outer membrane beta-barrel protein [Candidatus Polarisedimenticolia bacterium]|nr:outer membrane beta-barrel protein [Candidatus Polarisedimenticolia bacterium]